MGSFTERPSWATAPGAVRRRVETICASPVSHSADIHGGMSPGPAAILSLADARTGHPTLRSWQRARARAIRPLLDELAG